MEPNLAQPPPDFDFNNNTIPKPYAEPAEKKLDTAISKGVTQRKKDEETKKLRANTTTNSPEAIGQKRTSEFALHVLAALAVKLAIRTKSPERQKTPVKIAEQRYMNRLWDTYTKRALRI